MKYKGPYTRAHVRGLAREQGYFIAGNAQGGKGGWFVEVPVWGFREEDGQVLLCRFMASADHPHGYCDLPPVGGNIFPGNGVKANQLGLALTWGEV